MSQILENKQMIHIVSEVVVLIGLTFYFNQKNKKLLNHIEDLAQRIEEQEDLIQKHENIIKKLVSSINELHANNLPQALPKNVMKKPVPKTPLPKASPKVSPKVSPRTSPPPQFIQMEMPMETPQIVHSLSNQNFVDLEDELNRITEDSPSVNGEICEPEEEDLDSAIAEELQELQELQELIEVDTSDLSLKKQQ